MAAILLTFAMLPETWGGAEYILNNYHVDVIIGPADGWLSTFAACGGICVTDQPPCPAFRVRADHEGS